MCRSMCAGAGAFPALKPIATGKDGFNAPASAGAVPSTGAAPQPLPFSAGSWFTAPASSRCGAVQQHASPGIRSTACAQQGCTVLHVPRYPSHLLICISMTHPSHAKGCVLWHPLREQCPFAQLWCSGVICMHGLRDYAFHDACAVRPRRRPGVCRRRAVARGPRPLPSQHSPGAAPVSLPQHRQVRGHCFRWHL